MAILSIEDINNPAWQAKGLCHTGEYDPAIWFPRGNGTLTINQAKKICGQCPVAKQCLEWALLEEKKYGTRERVGVLGGLSANERRQLCFKICSHPRCLKPRRKDIPDLNNAKSGYCSKEHLNDHERIRYERHLREKRGARGDYYMKGRVTKIV